MEQDSVNSEHKAVSVSFIRGEYSRKERYSWELEKTNSRIAVIIVVLGFLEIVVSEMLLVPGVEALDSSQDDFELRVGSKAFAHVHKPDRIDIRLPPDVKENVLARGIASRSPEPHDREGWVVLKLGLNPQLPVLTRLLHQSYRFTSTML